jgi:hypothetical protein
MLLCSIHVGGKSEKVSSWDAFGRCSQLLCICPSCVLYAQALIVTHEMSKPQFWDSHISECLRPVQPLVCLGRSKSVEPAIWEGASLMTWWRDRAPATSRPGS